MIDDLTKRSLPIDHLALNGDRDAPALAFKTWKMSYNELDRRVGRIAAQLRERGLQPGDRVATWLGKSWLACLMPLAAVRAGLIHVPINPVLKRAQVAYILADSGSRLLITNRARAESLDKADLREDCAVLADHTLTSAAETDGLQLPPSSGDPENLGAILYTSGSTGRPKGVMLSSTNMWLGAESVATYLGLDHDDKVLAVLPLSFDYGQNQLLSAWYAGACVAPLDYLMPNEVVRAAERFEITTLAGVPPLWVQLIDHEWPMAVTRRMRRLTNSGGALTRHLVRRLRSIFPETRIFAMYGLTEAFRSTYLDPDLIDERPDSVGKAIPHAEILIVRPDGTPTEPDEPGELVHCGPLVAHGYWQDNERTAMRFKSAPSHSRFGGTAVWSGDKARVDAEGFITFVGRDDEMIKSSGNRISPTELEEAVQATGLASEAVAFGIPDPLLGHAIAIVVSASRQTPIEGNECTAEALEAALRGQLRADLPNFMQPRHILVRTNLPRNPNGKLDRLAITLDALKSLELEA